MNEYLADVHRYDSRASADRVDRIVKHLGVSLRRRESALVSCADEGELKRIVDGWCAERLGVTDLAVARAAVDAVCKQMDRDRSKQRVTFYYLCAAKLGKLGLL
jgi:hypothetical protein